MFGSFYRTCAAHISCAVCPDGCRYSCTASVACATIMCYKKAQNGHDEIPERFNFDLLSGFAIDSPAFDFIIQWWVAWSQVGKHAGIMAAWRFSGVNIAVDLLIQSARLWRCGLLPDSLRLLLQVCSRHSEKSILLDWGKVDRIMQKCVETSFDLANMLAVVFLLVYKATCTVMTKCEQYTNLQRFHLVVGRF